VTRPETHEEAVARLLATRAEQGLPPTITDPVAQEQAAWLLRTETTN
jgi:hypothetical protein